MVGVEHAAEVRRLVARCRLARGHTMRRWDRVRLPRSKYQFMEAQLQGTRSRLKAKHPDIKASLEALMLLKAKKARDQHICS